MVGHLSTSNSRPGSPHVRWLLPAISVLAIVFVSDHVAWNQLAPWTKIELALSDCGPRRRVVFHKAQSQTALAKLHGAKRDRWRVVVVGSSRAGAGFVPQNLPENDPALLTLNLFKVASAAIEPYTMRSLASRMRPAEVDEVVLYLSEFDTHRPPYLVPSIGFGGLGAWLDLVRFSGPRLAWHHRDELSRLGAAAILSTYRNRNVLQALARNIELRTDQIGSRNDMNDEPEESEGFHNALAMKAPVNGIMPWDEFGRVATEIQTHLAGPMVKGTYRQVRAISYGQHVDIQKALVRSTVDVLLSRGIRVLIVETPVHPLAERLYDLETRGDFRAFADELALDSRVEVFGLSQQPTYRGEEFRDLTHLSAPGAIRLTRGVVDRLAQQAQTYASSR